MNTLVFASKFAGKPRDDAGKQIMRRCLLPVVLAVVALGTTRARADATVEGRVLLPPPKPSATATAHYKATSTTAGKADPPAAVVYLEGSFPPVSTNTTPVKLEQQNLQFVPALLPVRVGTLVQFPNLDNEFHNVMSYSKAKVFDLGRYRKDEVQPSVVFDKPGVVELGCEIHEHMRGTILILDTPYFTKTSFSGAYRLEHLPAGNYVLKAWVNSRTVFSQPVELKDGTVVQVDFPAAISAK
ncbi:MAG TPA: hypothetical protein VHH73_15715 [Verrucomicrobiae bacterium]|nr:hypothetical protein [Verrucomicrobiae bacterium]